MKKSIKNRKKDRDKKAGKIWIDEHTPFEKRTCGSGLTFSGHYENEK